MRNEAYRIKDTCGGMGCKKHPNIKCWDCPEPDCIAQGNEMISRKQTKKKENEKMAKTLYDVLAESKDEEFTVTDSVYDVELYFSYLDGDKWDKSLMDIAKVLEVKRITSIGVVVVNLSDVIESKLEELDKADLFIECDVDAILDDIDNIFAGYVSESWMRKFADVMAGESNGRS